MITGYFMAPVRGMDGDSVTYETKWDNILFAREIAHAIQDDFPDIDLFIPHDHEEVIEGAMAFGATSEDILKWCCFIASQKDLPIRYEGHGISPGMQLESRVITSEGKRICGIAEYNETAKEKITQAVNELRKDEP